MEEGETPRTTAVRETCEELGIETKDIEVFGELNRIRAYSNFTMYAFLGSIDYDVIQEAQFNRAEVKEIFFVPLDFFLNSDPFIYECDVIPDIKSDFPYEKIRFKDGYNWRKGKTVIPIYEYKDRVIWGLTARVTLSLVEELRAFLG